MPRKKSPEDRIKALANTIADKEGVKHAVQCLRRALGDIEPVVRFCQEIADEVCDRMANGETVDQMGKEPHMPDARSIRRWTETHPGFGQAYARARVSQMHAWADQIVSLSDDEHETEYKVTVPLDSGEVERIEGDGQVTFRYTRRHIDRAKMMVDTRKWLMARVAADDFGEKQQVNVTHNFDQREDEEIVAELQSVLNETGLSIEDVMKMLAGPVQ